MKERALQLLRSSLADPAADFRAGQWEAIQSVLDGRRQLVVQRTGWGKSIVYFLATRLLRDQGKGMTIVISPLKSLMRNQREAAAALNLRTELSNSDNSDEEEARVRKCIADDSVDLLLTTPERLGKESFRNEVLQRVGTQNQIALFVVDEAHCISDWGHDFRPDYRRIVRVLRALPPNLPVLATTATANDRVVNDVRSQLGDDIQIVRGPLVRKSLHLQNIDLPNPIDRYTAIVQLLRQIDGAGIIYALTVNDAIRLTKWLRSQNIDAHAYYADLDKQDKTLRPRLEQRLLDNNLKALVATVALGMGFDKPDLAFVIHFQRPGSVVLYYQQVGRAGRAVDDAYGILMGGSEDDNISDYFIRSAFPPLAHVAEVLQALQKEDNQSTFELEKGLNLSHGQIDKTLKFLSVEDPAPVANTRSKWSATSHSLSYKVDQERLQGITDLRRREQDEMRSYMSHQGCLMRFLSEALDDPEAADCGKCSGCRGESHFSLESDPILQQQAAEFLRRTYQPIKPRLQKPAGRFQVFEALGAGMKRIPTHLLCEEGRALSIWGDPGWGEMVRKGKYPPASGVPRFEDSLVEGCAEMLQSWQPRPSPAWVTAIPSLRHPDLVPDFARRLAARLGLPFVSTLTKTRHGERQRDMQNSSHQIANLDGSLEIISEGLPTGPVLLVDDMVDSKWTFTVAGYLLRQRGVTAVFPLALALNSVSET